MLVVYDVMNIMSCCVSMSDDCGVESHVNDEIGVHYGLSSIANADYCPCLSAILIDLNVRIVSQDLLFDSPPSLLPLESPRNSTIHHGRDTRKP